MGLTFGAIEKVKRSYWWLTNSFCLIHAFSWPPFISSLLSDIKKERKEKNMAFKKPRYILKAVRTWKKNTLVQHHSKTWSYFVVTSSINILTKRVAVFFITFLLHKWLQFACLIITIVHQRLIFFYKLI